MRTTVTVPDDVMADLLKRTGEQSKSKAVRAAVDSFISQNKIDRALATYGCLKPEDDIYDELEQTNWEAQQKRDALLESIWDGSFFESHEDSSQGSKK